MTAQTALVLAGHGSHISPLTAGLIWRYVDILRQQGVADEITACFWKEQPSFFEVLDSVAADDITIVPVFTAQGYFTRTVIPAEVNLDGTITRRDGRTIRYGKTLGEHHGLADVVYQRAVKTLTHYDLDSQQTTVAIIGHGTKRSQHSQQATRDQVQLLAQRGIVAEVLDAYLDDDPDIPSIYHRAKTPNIIVVPFFLAPGSHVTIDVPHALGLHEDQSTAQINDKHIYYTDPIGTDDAVCRFILDLAYEAGMPHRANLEQLSTWSSFPQAGADLLVKQVQENANEGMEFGELLLKPDVVRPIGMSSTSINLDKPATLRAHIRENPFRPLASGRDLPRDWQVPVRNPTNIPAIVDTVYPGAVAAWAKQQQGQFTPNTLEGNIRRQQGNYKQLENLAEARIDRLVESVCGRCIKFPAWHKQNSKTNDIPCGDPCNIWLSGALEALKVQEQVV